VVTALAFVAATWGIAMAVSPVLQIRKMVEHRSSHGISIGYLGVLFVGFLLWLAYGISLPNWALIVPNTIAAVVCGVTIAVARHYRRPKRTAVS
jgi:MtN3 and saliva related transmembrane protein